MRQVVLHRRAAKYLRSMPRNRQLQVVQALEEIAALENPAEHPNIKPLLGEFSGWLRLRTGVYRSILQDRTDDTQSVIYVDYIGPRGDAY